MTGIDKGVSPSEMAKAGVAGFFAVVEEWSLDSEEAVRLLGSPVVFVLIHCAEDSGMLYTLSNDELDRLAQVAGIYAALNILYYTGSHREWLRNESRIAETARTSFTVMTPYLDEVGAAIVLNLFERANVPDKCLILRATPEGHAPPGLACVRTDLHQLGVVVLNFRLDRPDSSGNETFHAKVVLADDVSVYVGSSNMHMWSFEYSLELGLRVRGRTAARIADILRAVRAVSGPMSQ